MKVALVHDYLTEFGGAERVLVVLKEIFPAAPIYTSFAEQDVLQRLKLSRPTESMAEQAIQNLEQSGVGDCQIHSVNGFWSVLGKLATCFLPFAFESFDLGGYDVVISDGTIWSKGVLTSPEQLHIFYCHTPPRFLYGYPSEIDRRDTFLGPLLRPVDYLLRLWDYSSAQRPDVVVANSKNTARRIKKFWGRDVEEVIYPPVVNMSDKSNLSYAKGDFYLYVGRLSAYKNVDIAIKACNELGLSLKVAGTGREEDKLKDLAGPTVEMLGFVSNSELAELYSKCKAVIFPVSEEDFGIVPIEAMSYGKPVIALRGAGVDETVIEGKTGTFFSEPTVESLAVVLDHFDTSKYRSEDCIAQAKRFSKDNFVQEFRDLVEKCVSE